MKKISYKQCTNASDMDTKLWLDRNERQRKYTNIQELIIEKFRAKYKNNLNQIQLNRSTRKNFEEMKTLEGWNFVARKMH